MFFKGEGLNKWWHKYYIILLHNKKGWCMKQLGWISREFWVKETSPQRSHTEWLHLYAILKMRKLWNGEHEWLPGVRTRGWEQGEGGSGCVCERTAGGILVAMDWPWNCSVSCLVQCQHPGCGFVLQFCKHVTSWKNWIEGTWLVSVWFLKTVYESTSISK